MGKFFGGGKISTPAPEPLPEALPPDEERNTRELQEAVKRQRLAEKKRKGRQATILAGINNTDENDNLGSSGTVSRPSATAAPKSATLG